MLSHKLYSWSSLSYKLARAYIGGTEVNLWRTEQLTEEERVKVKEHLTEEQLAEQMKLQAATVDAKKYKSDVFYVDKKEAAEQRQEGESNVAFMAKSYQARVAPELTSESMVEGKEVSSLTQKQTQKEHLDGDLEVTRHITTTDTFEQQHKATTKEVRVSGQVEEATPPAFVEKIQPLIVQGGEQAMFKCTFTGTPVPKVTWFRENFILQNSRDIKVQCESAWKIIKRTEHSQVFFLFTRSKRLIPLHR